MGVGVIKITPADTHKHRGRETPLRSTGILHVCHSTNSSKAKGF